MNTVRTKGPTMPIVWMILLIAAVLAIVMTLIGRQSASQPVQQTNNTAQQASQ